MKQLLVIPLMLIALIGNSQNGIRIPTDEHFIVNVFLDYADDKQGGTGTNFVIEAGYSGFVEAKLGLESFSKLTGGYFDLHGAIGFKIVNGLKEQWNYYVGIRLAVVWRNDGYKPVPGLELQFTYDITDRWAFGVRYTNDHRYDMELLEWKVKNVSSAFVVLTYKIKRL